MNYSYGYAHIQKQQQHGSMVLLYYTNTVMTQNFYHKLEYFDE